MSPLGWAGVGMLIAAAVISLAALATTLPSLLQTRSRAILLSDNLELQLEAIRTLEEERKREFADLSVTLLPARKLYRFLKHPLVVALLDSYRRRRAKR